MKRLTVIFLSFILLITVAGCNMGGNKSNNILEIPYYDELDSLNPYDLIDTIEKRISLNIILTMLTIPIV